MNVQLIIREPGHLPRPVTMASTSGRIKILALGDSFVGKSTLIKAYCEGKFIPDYIPTIGIDYGVRSTTIEDVEVKINFWDVAGDPMYYEVRNEFYKDTHGVLLIFDLSSRKSYENLIQWIAEINKFINNVNRIVYLVGNKMDKEPRIISSDEGSRFAKKNNFKYKEITAKNIEEVNKLFDELFLDVINSYKTKNEDQDEDPIEEHQPSQSIASIKIQSGQISRNQTKSHSRTQSRKQSQVLINEQDEYISSSNIIEEAEKMLNNIDEKDTQDLLDENKIDNIITEEVNE